MAPRRLDGAGRIPHRRRHGVRKSRETLSALSPPPAAGATPPLRLGVQLCVNLLAPVEGVSALQDRQLLADQVLVDHGQFGVPVVEVTDDRQDVGPLQALGGFEAGTAGTLRKGAIARHHTVEKRL